MGRFPAPANARGFSLMEVLIAMLVLAIGLLGLAALQAQGLKFNNDAYTRSQANVLAHDMLDRIRISRRPDQPFTAASLAALIAPAANLTTTITNVNLAARLCDPTTLTFANDLNCWAEDLVAALPSPDAAIAVNATDPLFLDVSLMWLDREVTTEAVCGALVGHQWSNPGGAGVCRVVQTWTISP